MKLYYLVRKTKTEDMYYHSKLGKGWFHKIFMEESSSKDAPKKYQRPTPTKLKLSEAKSLLKELKHPEKWEIREV